MPAARDFFSRDYAEARRKFLEAAGAAGLKTEHHVNPERGRAGARGRMRCVSYVYTIGCGNPVPPPVPGGARPGICAFRKLR